MIYESRVMMCEYREKRNLGPRNNNRTFAIPDLYTLPCLRYRDADSPDSKPPTQGDSEGDL
jgi:hypothetical protein